MLYTDNIGLKKPAYNEPADIADINENSDIIDREFGNRYLKSETYSVEQANNAIAQAIEALPNGLVYRGAVNYYKDLPTANNELGNTYSVKYQGETGTTADGNEYAWGEYDGTLQWIKLGVNAYTKNEIDEQHEVIKSDISSLEENKISFVESRGYSGSASGWFNVGRCTYPIESVDTPRVATVYIEFTGAENSDKAALLRLIVSNTASYPAYTRMIALFNKGVTENDIKLVSSYSSSSGKITGELWVRTSAANQGYNLTVISKGLREYNINPSSNDSTQWTFFARTTPQQTAPSGHKNATITDYYGDVIKALSDRITALENK